MAFVSLPGYMEFPSLDPVFYNNNNTGSTFQLNAAADWIGYVFTVPKTGTLEGVHILMTAQAAIENLHISFQNVVAGTGVPDNVVDEFRIITPVGGDIDNFRFSGIMSDDGTDVGVKRSVTKGDKLAVVIKIDSFSAGDITIRRGMAQSGTLDTHPYPVQTTNSGSTWTQFVEYPPLALEYETDGVVMVPNLYPLTGFQAESASSSTTPDEFGMKFQVPIDMRVRGVVTSGTTTGLTVSIENSIGTQLIGPVSPLRDDATPATVKRHWDFFGSVDLVANTTYYVVWTPDATSRTIRSYDTNTTVRNALPFQAFGTWNERTDGGAWTEVTTKWGPFGLIVEAIEDGAVAAGDAFLPRIQMAGSPGPIPVY